MSNTVLVYLNLLNNTRMLHIDLSCIKLVQAAESSNVCNLFVQMLKQSSITLFSNACMQSALSARSTDIFQIFEVVLCLSFALKNKSGDHVFVSG